MIANEHRVSFQSDKNVLKLVAMGTQLCEYTKKIHLTVQFKGANFMVISQF